jgi:hypothetical protein
VETMVVSRTTAVPILHLDINVFLPSHVRKTTRPVCAEQLQQLALLSKDVQVLQEHQLVHQSCLLHQ